MTKPVPTLTHDPLYYGIVANATYEEPSAMGRVENFLSNFGSPFRAVQSLWKSESIDDYIHTNYSEAEVLERGKVTLIDGNSCHFFLVRDKEELTVAFRGTDSWVNDGPSNLVHQFGVPLSLIREVEFKIAKWEITHGKIHVLTGHSRGGFFATQVMKERDVFRVVFNAHRPELGEHNINLGTEGDILTMFGLSDISRVKIIGPGGHGMQEVLPLLQDKTWDAIMTNGCAVLSEQDDHSLQNITSECGDEAGELGNAFEQNTINPNPDKLIKRMEAFLVATLPITHEIDQLFTKFTSFVMDAINDVALGLYSWRRGSNFEKQRKAHAKQQEQQCEDLNDAMKRRIQGQQFERSLQQLEFLLTHQSNSHGMRDTVREIKTYSEQYKKDMALLIESLEKNQQLGQRIEDQLRNFDLLEDGIKKQRAKTLASQKKLGEKLRKLGGILRVTSEVLRYIPGAGIASEAVRVAQGVHQIAGRALEKERSKADQWLLETRQKEMRSREMCYGLVSQNNSMSDHLQRSQYELQVILFHRGVLTPECRLNALKQTVQQQTKRVTDLKSEEQKKIAESTALQAHLAGLHARNQTLAADFNKIKRKKHKKKAQAGQRLQGARVDLAAANVNSLSVEQEKLALQPLLQKNQQHLDEAQKCLEEAAYVAPLEMQIWAVLEEEEARWSSDNEQTRQLQDVSQDNVARYVQSRQREHQVIGGLMNAAQEFTAELERMTGHQKSGQFVSLGSQLYHLHDLKKYWFDCAYPQLQLLRDSYSNGTFDDVVKKLGYAAFLLQYVAPAIHTVTVGLSCMRMSYELVRRTPPVKTRLPEYMRHLVPETLTQLPMEAELQLQALGLTLQMFTSKLDQEVELLQKRIVKVDEKLSAELSEVRQCLNSVGDQLLHEIDASRREILQKLDHTTYDQYVARIKSNIAQSSNQISGLKTQLLDARDKTTSFLHFLQTIETGMENASLDINNGINLGYGRSGKPDHPYEAVDLSLIHRNPTCFTGLLAKKIGIKEPVPSWAVFEALTRSFIGVMQTVNANKEYQRILRTNETVRSQLATIYLKIFEQQKLLASIFEHMAPMIRDMVKRQKKLWLEIIERTKYVRLRTSVYMKKVQQVGYDEHSTPHQVPNADFVGASKFFLFSEFRQQTFQTRVSPNFQSRFYEQYQVSSPLSQDGTFFERIQESALQKVVIVGEGILETTRLCNQYIPQGFNLSGAVGLSSVECAVLASTGVLGNVAVRFGTSIQRRRFNHNEQAIQRIIKQPLATICSPQSSGITFSQPKTVVIQEDFYLDLKSRQVVGSSTGPATGKAPLFSLGVDVNKPELRMQFHEASVVQRDELEEIPSPGFLHENVLEYNKALKNLIGNYSSFLHHMIVGKSVLAETNPFQSIGKSCQIVSGIQEGMIPLVLPKTFLKKLGDRLRIELHYLEGTGLGSLIPFYELRKEKNNNYSILIKYRFVNVENPRTDRDFCSFKIAEFDQITVRAFQKEFSSSEAPECTNEFLIQAFYGSFGDETISDLLPQAQRCIDQNSLESIQELGVQAIQDEYVKIANDLNQMRNSDKLATSPDLIPNYARDVGKFSEKEIAQYLWLDLEARLSDFVQKVNEVAVYLYNQGFELRGVKADGNCFCSAFLKSYETLNQKIPILDAQEDKISYLRGLIASQYRETQKESDGAGRVRAEEIEVNKEWITASGEGDLLAKALDIPIRVVTVEQSEGRCGTSDMLTWPNNAREQQDWDNIAQLDKPKEFILIVDLGGHFICAQKIRRVAESSRNSPDTRFSTCQLDVERLMNLVGSVYSLTSFPPDSVQTRGLSKLYARLRNLYKKELSNISKKIQQFFHDQPKRTAISQNNAQNIPPAATPNQTTTSSISEELDETISDLLPQAQRCIDQNSLESIQDLGVKAIHDEYVKIADDINQMRHLNEIDVEQLITLVGRIKSLAEFPPGPVQTDLFELCKLYARLRNLYEKELLNISKKIRQPSDDQSSHSAISQKNSSSDTNKNNNIQKTSPAAQPNQTTTSSIGEKLDEILSNFLPQAQRCIDQNSLESIQELGVEAIQAEYVKIANDLNQMRNSDEIDVERLMNLVATVYSLTSFPLGSVQTGLSELCELYAQLRSLYKKELSNISKKIQQSSHDQSSHSAISQNNSLVDINNNNNAPNIPPAAPPNQTTISSIGEEIATNLGLPGKETLLLKSGLIAPKEVPFIGLYRIWEAFPNLMISYKSYEYSEASDIDLRKKIEDQQAREAQRNATAPVQTTKPKEAKGPSPSAAMMRPISIPELGNDYLAIWREMHRSKKAIQKVEAEVKKDFSLFLAMVNLVAELDHSTLSREMELLHLLAPEQQEALYDRCDLEQAFKVSDDEIRRFVKVCKGVPSQALIQLRTDFTEISELIQNLQQNPSLLSNQIESVN